MKKSILYLCLFASIILISFLFTSCKKWKYGWPDTQFRNKFVGTYQIDSIVKRLANIDSISGLRDTNSTVYPFNNDYLEILHTKDQVEKNVTCTGKFLDSVFRYEVQGFADKGAERFSFTSCNDCNYSEMFNHIYGTRYVVWWKDKSLILESRFILNDKHFFTKLFLTKK